MNSKTKTILLIVIFIAAMIGASALYTGLSQKVSVGGLVADEKGTVMVASQYEGTMKQMEQMNQNLVQRTKQQ